MNGKLYKIYVFEGRYTREDKDEFIKQFEKTAFYTEYDFTNVSSKDRARLGGESKIVLHSFTRFVARIISDAKSTGKKPIVLIDDFVSRIDEAIDFSQNIKPLFDVSKKVIYFAEHTSSVKRLRESNLIVEVYKKVEGKEMIRGNDEGFEYLMSMLPAGADKSCALNLLPRALDFVRERDTEFATVDIQKFLKAKYGRVVKVIDAMLALCVIEITEERPRKYKRICEKDEINHDIYYNGGVYAADNKSHTGWDPSLFKSKQDCIDYLKSNYGDCFENTVYWIETVKVGNDWYVIKREEFRENEI